MLEAAGGVAGLVLEVQFDARQAGSLQGDQMGIGAALEIRFDDADRLAGPLALVDGHGNSFSSGRRQEAAAERCATG
ncbi:Uncharacterised protein [Acinetobacter baumannii]|nr:Uncharacterised protein [Acinetobacter baumannii]